MTVTFSSTQKIALSSFVLKRRSAFDGVEGVARFAPTRFADVADVVDSAVPLLLNIISIEWLGWQATKS
jgi:hypothetical protein